MNRRDFVKALAGIPLLGLLVKVPEAKELRAAQCRVSQDWFLPSDKEPYHAVASMGSVEYADNSDWFYIGDGEYVRLRKRWSLTEADRMADEMMNV